MIDVIVLANKYMSEMMHGFCFCGGFFLFFLEHVINSCKLIGEYFQTLKTSNATHACDIRYVKYMHNNKEKQPTYSWKQTKQEV